MNNRGGWNNRGVGQGWENSVGRFLVHKCEAKHNAFFFFFQQTGKYSLYNLIQEN